MNLLAIDLFSGCGGLTQGMREAGFVVVAALDNNSDAIKTFKLNHTETHVFEKDLRDFESREIAEILYGQTLHLLAGCPPCQGFSSVRRLNKKQAVEDERNDLVSDFLRLIDEFEPLTLMMENVPGLKSYKLFDQMIVKLKENGYHCEYDVVDIQHYGVPQRRKRLVLVGSRLGEIRVAPPTWEKQTVEQTIGPLDKPEETDDPLHKIVMQHEERIRKLISLIPKNGGSRKDLPQDFILDCHKKKNVGFNDIYGRLRWEDVSSTITGGCLNPSKGRFLHPEQDRVITPREAALLQTFPAYYKFPSGIKKASLASLIGNALPPKFSYIQCKSIREHLEQYLV